MELPNGNMNDLDSELQKLYINTSIDLFEERALAGDEHAGEYLKVLGDTLKVCAEALPDQPERVRKALAD